MKVILLKDHKELGKEGEVKEVKEGYAMNFLFPHHIATEASPEALAHLEEARKAVRKAESQRMNVNRDAAAALDGYELLISMRTNEDQTLYATVDAKSVAKLLRQEGYEVKKEQVRMNPMKETGEQMVQVHFEGGFEAEVKLIVEPAL